MKPFTRMAIGICLVVMILLAPSLVTQAAPDETAHTIELSGIPGPYSFDQICKLQSGDVWLVGGTGSARYYSNQGAANRKMHLAEGALRGVFFVNAQQGWIVGEQGLIFNTKDGGLTWDKQTSGVTAGLEAIRCTDENRCWSVGEKATILTTEDGGNHWEKRNSGSSAHLYAIDFVNHGTGWVVGQDGFVARTKDGGQTWEKQHVPIILFPNGPYAAPTDLLTVRFTDENHGWVAGAGGIARTVDAGKTWEVQEVKYNSFIGLVSHDGKNLWAISETGPNYFSDDAGVSWGPLKDERASAKQYRKDN